jgi:SAM-dependent methyltransferase
MIFMGEPNALTTDGVHDEVMAIVAAYLRTPARSADLGAGEGALTAKLRAAGFDVVPVDRCASRWRLPGTPIEVDLNERFAERLGNLFDAVVAVEVVEHLENPFGFVRECADVLKPDGILILTTPNVESLASRLIFLWNGRLRTFSPDEAVSSHHRMPVFSWMLGMALEEAHLTLLKTRFTPNSWDMGVSLKARLARWLGRAISPFVVGDRFGEVRVVVAKRGAGNNQDAARGRTVSRSTRALPEAGVGARGV